MNLAAGSTNHHNYNVESPGRVSGLRALPKLLHIYMLRCEFLNHSKSSLVHQLSGLTNLPPFSWWTIKKSSSLLYCKLCASIKGPWKLGISPNNYSSPLRDLMCQCTDILNLGSQGQRSCLHILATGREMLGCSLKQTAVPFPHFWIVGNIIWDTTQKWDPGLWALVMVVMVMVSLSDDRRSIGSPVVISNDARLEQCFSILLLWVLCSMESQIHQNCIWRTSDHSH